jgi:hypothetical protein
MSNSPTDSSVEQHTGIFDENNPDVLDEFGQLCEQVGINTAIAIIQDKDTGKPMVFVRGHLYDVGCLTSTVLQGIKADLMRGLNLLIVVVYSFLL